jgi:hypothetical protein
VILLLRSRELPDTELAEPRPVDVAWQPHQAILRKAADNAFRLAAFFESVDQVNLVAARQALDFGRRRAPAFKLLVNPWDEQKIARAGLDGAGRREQQVGPAVADAAEAQLVARVLFVKERDDVGHFAAVLFRKVHPGEHRGHSLALRAHQWNSPSICTRSVWPPRDAKERKRQVRTIICWCLPARLSASNIRLMRSSSQ